MFDNTKLYSFKNGLDQTEYTVDYGRKDHPTEYTITFKFVKPFFPDDENFPTQPINLLLRSLMMNKGYIISGTNLLDKRNPCLMEKFGIEIYNGVHFLIYKGEYGYLALGDKTDVIIRTKSVLEIYNK